MIKKTLLLAAAVCLLIPIGVQAQNGIDPDKEFYTANFSQNEIILDGDLSEWTGVDVIESPSFTPAGAGGPRVTFEEFGDGTWSGPDDHSVDILITWDEDSVYLGMIVTDDYHENAANSGWNGDSAQVLLAEADRSTRIALYNYALGGIEGALGEVIIMEESGPGGTDAVVARDGNITTYEIQFPKASLGFADLFEGLEFGLGMAVNDGDEATPGQKGWSGLGPDVVVHGKEPDQSALITLGPEVANDFFLNGGGQTYSENFDGMLTGRRLPRGWRGTTPDGGRGSANGLGLTDGFLTVPGDPADGVLGILNLGGNEGSFSTPGGDFIPTWNAELGGANDLFGRDDVIADAAIDRALGVGRENNDDAGELNFEIEIVDGALRAFVFDWDLEIWGGDPDGAFRSPEGPGMKVEVSVGGNSYGTMTENLLPGAAFDSLEDGGDTDHNPTLINGNVHSIRGISSGIKEVSSADGAVGNTVQINFNSNWNGATDSGANGWFSAVDNVRLRALAPGDADANGVVDVADLLQLLGGQKFNQGVDGVTWEQGDFNADDQFNTGDLLAMLSFLSGTFPSDPYASEAGGANDAVADIIVNSETGEVTVDLAGHTVSAIIIESASEIFNGSEPAWDTTSQFPSTLPGELGNVLFTSTAAGVDELGAVISAEFLGRDKEFYLQDLDLNILIASEGGALTKGNVIVVPEPSTWMLLGLGSLAMVAIVRRRQS